MWETSNRRGTQSWAEKWSIFVLRSHLDPIGEQNDVQYFSISCQYWSIYGTAYGIIAGNSIELIDNSLFNTNIIYNPIFNDINTFFIWIGNPNPCLRRFRLAAGSLFCEKQHAFLKNNCFCQYLTIFSVFVYFGKHQIDAERNPEPTNCRISSWALI